MDENKLSEVKTAEYEQPILQKAVLSEPKNESISTPVETIPMQKKQGIMCPSCHGYNVLVQTVQENQGSVSVSKTKSKYKEKGHGIVWWLTIGWWWWAVDLFLWFFAFLPRLILRLFAAPFKKKKGVGKSTTVETTTNKIVYKTICTCQNCGHTWQKAKL